MKKKITLVFTCLLLVCSAFGQNTFSIKGNKTYINNEETQLIGLRCSNALLNDKSTNDLISNLDIYKEYGINSISVFFMGSRYSDIYGYEPDGKIKEVYKKRMSKIIEACDKRGMIVLVGVLYWGGAVQGKLENPDYDNWGQKEVNAAIVNTVKWLKENNYKNVFVDPDNEGMAERTKKFNVDEMICEAKKAVPEIFVAYNNQSYPPPCADLSIHFGWKTQNLPYIETEGTPNEYWLEYSKEKGLKQYINVGIYTEGKKERQIKRTQNLLDKGYGYFFASTWLQNVPPNFHIGGDGSPCNPGMKWWLEFIKENYKEK